jgi:hypothetical protein
LENRDEGYVRVQVVRLVLARVDVGNWGFVRLRVR